MIIDEKKIRERTRTGIASRPVSRVRIQRPYKPSPVAALAEKVKSAMGIATIAAVTAGVAYLIITLALQSARYAEIRAEKKEAEREKAEAVRNAPEKPREIFVPATYRPAK